MMSSVLAPSGLRELWNIQRGRSGWQSDTWLCPSGERAAQIQNRETSAERLKGMAVSRACHRVRRAVGQGKGSHSRDWGGTAREGESLVRILDLQGKSD